MAADGQIVLGLNISETTSQISTDLNTVINDLRTKQLVIKAAIEKSEAEKGITQLVKELNKQKAKIGVEIDWNDTAKLITQQQKIASVQNKLIDQMRQYKELASSVGVVLSKSTQQSFNTAIDAKNLDAAKEALRSVKKEIDTYNTAVRNMNSDVKLKFDIKDIQTKFANLDTSTRKTTSLMNQLQTAQQKFGNARTDSSKLKYYTELRSVLEKLNAEYKFVSLDETQTQKKNTLIKGIQDARAELNNFKKEFSQLGDTEGAKKLSATMTELQDSLKNAGRSSYSNKTLETQYDKVATSLLNVKQAAKEYNAELQKYNTAISNMNSDIKLDFNVSNIQTKFSDLNVSTQKSIQLLNDLQISYDGFNKAGTDSEKLNYYTQLNDILEQLDVEYKSLNQSEARSGKKSSYLKNIQDARAELERLKNEYNELGDDGSAKKLKDSITQLETALKDSGGISSTNKELKNQWDNISSSILNARQAVKDYNAETKKSNTATAKDELRIKDLQNAEVLLKRMQTLYSNASGSKGAEPLKQTITALNEALNEATKTEGKYSATGSELEKQWENVSAKVQAAKDALTQYKAEQSAIRKQTNGLNSIIESVDNFQTNISNSGFKGDRIEQLKTNLDSAKNSAIELKENISKIDFADENVSKDLEKINKDTDELIKSFSELAKGEASVFKDTASVQKFANDIDKARKKVEDYDNTYSAIKSRPELVRELEELRQSAEAIRTPSELKAFNKQFEAFDNKVVEAGAHCKSFGDRLKTAFQNFASFFSASRIIYQIVDKLKEMVSNVIELNSAMVELRKVTSATSSEFNAFLDDAKDKAVDLGSTVVDLVNATADFSRLGYSLEDAEELGRVATIYLNVGDDVETIDDATTSLISTMKGFGMEAEDAMSIIDKFNEVGKLIA